MRGFGNDQVIDVSYSAINYGGDISNGKRRVAVKGLNVFYILCILKQINSVINVYFIGVVEM